MLRAIGLLAVMSGPAWASPSLLDSDAEQVDGSGTHGLRLLAEGPPSPAPAQAPAFGDAPTREALLGQIHLVERELRERPSRGGPIAMMIVGFALGGVILVADGFVLALFGLAALAGGRDAILGTAALVCGLIGVGGLLFIGLGVVGAILNGRVSRRHAEAQRELREELGELRRQLNVLDAGPPPPMPGVLWSRPRMIELASF
jgi:hypothetical protein